PIGAGHAPTGIFFDEQTPESVIAAVKRFELESEQISPLACRANAERFSIAAFRAAYRHQVEEALAKAGSSERCPL
ncbi:MAG TPA: glycosyltransferase family 4 protein, partial [Ramlibacter sp.]|nr:glycosyltransferase family 4 protein [Ramlibacter sp.]